MVEWFSIWNICNVYFRWRAVSFRCGEHGVWRRSVLPVRLPHGSGVRDAGHGVPGGRRCLSVRAAEEQAVAAARQQSTRLARQSVAHHRPEQSQQPVRLVLRQNLSKKQTRFLLNGSTKLTLRLIDIHAKRRERKEMVIGRPHNIYLYKYVI